MRLKFITTAVVALALALGARSAEAAAILVIDDLSTTGLDVIIADGVTAGGSTSVGVTTNDDTGIGTGVVGYQGIVGTFNVNVVTGLSKPIIGNPYSAEIDLNFVSVSSGAGTLAMYFLDTDFLLPNTAVLPIQLTSSFGGTTQGTVQSSGCIDATNSGTPFGTTCLDGGPYGPGAFAASLSGATSGPIGSGPFQLIQGVLVTHTGSGVSSGDAHLLATVPEPGSLLLLGGGLLGLAGVVRRRMRNARS